jgi:hypothetical protein
MVAQFKGNGFSSLIREIWKFDYFKFFHEKNVESFKGKGKKENSDTYPRIRIRKIFNCQFSIWATTRDCPYFLPFFIPSILPYSLNKFWISPEMEYDLSG